MSGFGLPETARLARRALEGGPPVALAVVVAALDPALVGRRIAWDGERLHGDLGDEMWTAEATALLRAAGAGSGCHEIGGGVELYVERIEPPADLVIVGAGHIAQPLAGIGKLLGFRVTVLDDRPDFARRARFPDADHVIVADFSEPFAGVPIHDRTHLVLVTRGHRYDYDCLRALAAMGVEPAYIGMIGSRRRVRAAFEQLAQEGFDATWLARVQAPIGLDIGAETPAEIAVAIAAEMILIARGGSGRPLRDVAQVVRYVKSLAAETSALGAGVEPDGAARGEPMNEARVVFAALEDAAATGRPVVLATIVRAKGSVPRGVGSKMVIDPEAGPVGTIGGGCGEAQVLTEARAALADGQPRIVRVDLTEDLFSWSPAICGGIFDVLIEPFASA